MASAAADTKPIRRMARRRRPEGSANTGLECTARSVATLVTANPGFTGPVHHETAPRVDGASGRFERDQRHIDPSQTAPSRRLTDASWVGIIYTGIPY
jgi:hypothetical protein